jgi:hypothetical protein
MLFFIISDKLKAIARAEPVSTKTFGNVQTVPAVFMFVTSNRKLMTHVFDKPEKKGKIFNRVYKSDLKQSKSVHTGDIDAVQNRFIEAFVRSRPALPDNCMPTNENFSRLHVILGLYNIIVELLVKYNKEDFKAPYMYLYPISGLCKNLEQLNSDNRDKMKDIMFGIMLKYKLDEKQIETCCKSMNYFPVKQEQ